MELLDHVLALGFICWETATVSHSSRTCYTFPPEAGMCVCPCVRLCVRERGDVITTSRRVGSLPTAAVCVPRRVVLVPSPPRSVLGEAVPLLCRQWVLWVPSGFGHAFPFI